MKRKVWTAEDDGDLRYWHALGYTDGRIAWKLGCCRRTVLRQRETMGLRAADHPGRGRDSGERKVPADDEYCRYVDCNRHEAPPELSRR